VLSVLFVWIVVEPNAKQPEINDDPPLVQAQVGETIRSPAGGTWLLFWNSSRRNENIRMIAEQTRSSANRFFEK